MRKQLELLIQITQELTELVELHYELMKADDSYNFETYRRNQNIKSLIKELKNG